MQELLDAIPVWGIFGITLALLLAAAEAGRRLALRGKRPSDSKDAAHGTLVGATLGLFAFLLAFAFGVAATRYDTRRKLVIEDANAVGTTYLRARMLPDPHAGEVERLLREYVTLRASASGAAGLAPVLARSEELQAALWREAVAAAKEAPNPVTALFVTSLNELIDLHAERLTVALENRVPTVVWFYLYVLGVFAMAMVGHEAGVLGIGHRKGMVVLIAAFSMVMVLVMELDRPLHGVPVSQKPMIDVARMMQSSGH